MVEEAELEIPAPFGWVGGKKQLSKTIVRLIPPHRTYVEPFCGAASVFWAKEPSELEVLNDLDPDLMRFYRNIGGIDRCNIAQLGKDFKALKARDGKLGVCEFLAEVMCSYGTGRTSVAGPGTVARKTCLNNAPQFHSRLPRYQERIKGVKLLCSDWEKVVSQYDSLGTFFYFDPPYHGTTRKYKYSDDQLARLADVLPKLKGKWILSYDDHPDVKQAFFGYSMLAAKTRYTLQQSGEQYGKQLLIANYPLEAKMAEMTPLLRWQYDQITKEMLLLQQHLASTDCPCETETENCVRKHLLTLEALMEETLPMVNGEERDNMDDDLAYIREMRKRYEQQVCPIEASAREEQAGKLTAELGGLVEAVVTGVGLGVGFGAVDFVRKKLATPPEVEKYIKEGEMAADEWRDYKEYKVHRYTVIGTDIEIYDVWESDSNDHTTIHSIGGVWWGRVGSRILPQELEGLRPYSQERAQKVRRWQDTEYNRAYEVIKEAYPEIDRSRARYSMGEIIVRGEIIPAIKVKEGEMGEGKLAPTISVISYIYRGFEIVLNKRDGLYHTQYGTFNTMEQAVRDIDSRFKHGKPKPLPSKFRDTPLDQAEMGNKTKKVSIEFNEHELSILQWMLDKEAKTFDYKPQAEEEILIYDMLSRIQSVEQTLSEEIPQADMSEEDITALLEAKERQVPKLIDVYPNSIHKHYLATDSCHRDSFRLAPSAAGTSVYLCCEKGNKWDPKTDTCTPRQSVVMTIVQPTPKNLAEVKEWEDYGVPVKRHKYEGVEPRAKSAPAKGYREDDMAEIEKAIASAEVID